MQKLLIASGIYPPDIGGPATYSQTIAREFTKQGINVSLICYSDKKQEDNENFKIVRILRKNKLFRYLLYFWNLLKLARNCDVIYAQGPLAAGLPAMWVSKIKRKKFVLKIVGDYAWEQGVNQFGVKELIEEFQNKKYNSRIERIRRIQKKVCKSADKIIVPSEFLKKIVKGWGINENKIKVIYNSFDGRGYTQNKSRQVGNTQTNAEALASIGVSPKADNQRVSVDIIISAGRPEPWKGFDTLDEIMPDLLKENPKFKLVIATKLSHNELMAYFKTSMIFVLNSGYEGFSHILLEAMACELPVVTTNVCGNPEIIQNGENGLLVEYNNKEQIKNAILRIWKDNSLREKLINNGRKTLEKFKLEDMIDRTINVLNLKNMSRPKSGSRQRSGKLLMITGDRALAQGKKGPFYYMLEEFSQYWERIDIICPRLRQPASPAGGGFGGQAKPCVQKFFNNVYVHSSNLPKIFHPWFILKKGTEIFKEQKFDFFTIHSYPPFYNDIGGYWLYNKIKVPYVLEIMHINGHPKAGNIKEWIYKILTKLFINFFARKSSAVRVINYKQVPEFLIKSGVEEKKIKIAPAFYIDFEVFKPSAAEKKYDIVFSGRLVKNKGIKLLIGAVKILKSQIPNIKLMIIGSGPLENKIKKYVKKNGLQNNVVFSGWLPSVDDVAEVYNQSKIMVMSSFNEGGPRVILEAMACKIPVITSRVGIMLDIIQDLSSASGQVNGLFIDWDANDIAQKIILLLNDGSLRNKIAENGYQTVQRFERKKVIENYAKIYQALLYSA